MDTVEIESFGGADQRWFYSFYSRMFYVPIWFFCVYVLLFFVYMVCGGSRDPSLFDLCCEGERGGNVVYLGVHHVCSIKLFCWFVEKEKENVD